MSFAENSVGTNIDPTSWGDHSITHWERKVVINHCAILNKFQKGRFLLL